ncbi:MAG: hypothetical protein P8X91_00575 [Candidatus Bathyarchaeota archaeon]
MNSANWYKLFVVTFGAGVILFIISILAAISDQELGFFRDFGNFGLLISTFIFVAAYICYQRYKVQLFIENSKK